MRTKEQKTYIVPKKAPEPSAYIKCTKCELVYARYRNAYVGCPHCGNKSFTNT